MKFRIFALIFFVAAAPVINSCSEDDEEFENIKQIQSYLQSGSWLVLNFLERGSDETYHYFGYNITFAKNGDLSASNGSNTVNGTWQVAKTSNGVKMIIDFNAFNKFEDLNEDWDFVSYSPIRIDLMHVSGGNGGTKYLNIQKVN